MSLPDNVSLMVGKRVLQGYVSGIQKVQLEDPDIRPILKKKLKSADRLSRQEIAPERPATKRYWALWDSLPVSSSSSSFKITRCVLKQRSCCFKTGR
ncbi:hypothetical protein AVEN_203967-1 [Araneus ventricosus]|uniref:Uncharacterized protein n=1 Tax=Araneus ventricosus TaxID=182803 RepID=A0A4Y2T0Y4_ARAVE|nr:hypothetical protein AVEN_203967-1 [Araneus ventricosus]